MHKGQINLSASHKYTWAKALSLQKFGFDSLLNVL